MEEAKLKKLAVIIAALILSISLSFSASGAQEIHPNIQKQGSHFCDLDQVGVVHWKWWGTTSSVQITPLPWWTVHFAHPEIRTTKVFGVPGQWVYQWFIRMSGDNYFIGKPWMTCRIVG